MVKRIVIGFSKSQGQNAAARFLIAFLSVLCDLCGKAFAAVSYIHEMKRPQDQGICRTSPILMSSRSVMLFNLAISSMVVSNSWATS